MDLQEKILHVLYIIPAILVAFTVHEYAHAWVADRLGDKTPKFQGRLTLNPIVHIDPIGFIMILIAGFGWAKPVQTNPSAFKHYYKDDLKVSIAGVIGNFIAAIVFSLLFGIFYKFALSMNLSVAQILGSMLQEGIYFNCVLIFFNLLPLPGLDGFHVLRDLYPKTFYNISDTLYKYQMIILLLFIATPIAGIIIGTPTDMLYSFLRKLAISL